MVDLNNARTQVNSEVHIHTNNTNEHIVVEKLNFKGRLVINMDLSLLTKNLFIKIQEKTDGTNYRIKAFKNFDQARFEIDAVTDNGGKAQYQTTLPHGLTGGDVVITRDFNGVPSYNTEDTISLVPDTTHFELTNVNFDVSTDTGYVVTPSTINDYIFGTQVPVADIEGSGNDVKLTFQSQVAEGADRDIPLTIRVTTPL